MSHLDTMLIGPGRPCWECGEGYGMHLSTCSVSVANLDRKYRPRRFRIRLETGEKHPNGSDSRYRYGCYFPLTDVVVGDMGGRGTGIPENVEWIDETAKTEGQ